MHLLPRPLSDAVGTHTYSTLASCITAIVPPARRERRVGPKPQDGGVFPKAGECEFLNSVLGFGQELSHSFLRAFSRRAKYVIIHVGTSA